MARMTVEEIHEMLDAHGVSGHDFWGHAMGGDRAPLPEAVVTRLLADMGAQIPQYRCCDSAWENTDYEYTMAEFLEMCAACWGTAPDLRERGGNWYDVATGELVLEHVRQP